VAVRVLCADTHPDHDSICKFRRENKELLTSVFHQVLELEANARVLKVGDITVSIDGTRVRAKASKHGAMSHDQLEKQMKLAEEQIGELLAKAEGADSDPLQDGLSIPKEPERSGDSQPQAARRVSETKQIRRREDRIAELKEAKKVMEERAKARFEIEQAEYEAKLAAREAKEKETGKKSGARSPNLPHPIPAPRTSLTSPIPKAGL